MAEQKTLAPQAPLAARGDLAAAIGMWLHTLATGRRLAPKTLEAYRRDVSQFLAFLQDHLGGPAGLSDLAGLKVTDIRSFLASRRRDDVGDRRSCRQLVDARHRHPAPSPQKFRPR